MQYEIKGSPMPVVVCTLNAGEQMITQGGGMSWMSDGITMQTGTNGGLGKALGRMLTREAIFQNTYTSNVNGAFIAFASTFMGDIMALELQPGVEYVCQKSAFLASTPGVNVEMFFRPKLKAGLFGGEGFIMQKFSGQGLAFIEVDGSAVKYNLAPGERLILDTGHLIMMSATCTLDTQTVKGAKNILFGGEGLFNTVVTGPGEVMVQTMPIPKLAGSIAPYIPQKTN